MHKKTLHVRQATFNVNFVKTYVNHILRPSCTCCSLRINLAICKTNCLVVSFEWRGFRLKVSFKTRKFSLKREISCSGLMNKRNTAVAMRRLFRKTERCYYKEKVYKYVGVEIESNNLCAAK